MAAWGLLILIIVIIVLYFVVSKVYYEHKIKTGKQQLAGKVILFSKKKCVDINVLFQLEQKSLYSVSCIWKIQSLSNNRITIKIRLSRKKSGSHLQYVCVLECNIVDVGICVNDIINTHPTLI